MTVAQSVAEVLDEHVILQLECIDRVYCNLYVPMLQTEGGVAWFFREHRGHDFASSALMAPMTRKFVESVEAFAQREGIELITFKRGERKEEVAQRYLAEFPGQEGVLFIGKAQEKAPVVRTERRRNPATGATYAWLVKTTLFVNYYYFYCIDRDFGPFFIKLCSYFPYNGKLCLNGHEYLKRQLSRRGIVFQALDNGILSCADPEQMQSSPMGSTRRRSMVWPASGSGACRIPSQLEIAPPAFVTTSASYKRNSRSLRSSTDRFQAASFSSRSSATTWMRVGPTKSS
jgi:hypothetical protein